MQGAGNTIIDYAAKVAACYRKLILWKSYVARDEYYMFPEQANHTVIGQANHKYAVNTSMTVSQVMIGFGGGHASTGRINSAQLKRIYLFVRTVTLTMI